MIDLIEILFKDLLRVLGLIVRAAIWLISELFFETIAWYVGWPICRFLSLGRFPEQAIHDREAASQLAQALVSLVGFIFLVLLAIAIARYAGEIRLN